MFIVVHFVGKEDNSVEGVPSTWVVTVGGQTFCRWPEKPPSCGMTSLIKRSSEPKETWSLARCIVKHKANTYEEMRLKTEEAQYITDVEQSRASLQSPESTKDPSSDSDSSQVPSPPPKEKTTHRKMKPDFSPAKLKGTQTPTNKKKQKRQVIEFSSDSECILTTPKKQKANDSEAITKLVKEMKTELKQETKKIENKVDEVFKVVVNLKEELKSVKKMMKHSEKETPKSKLPPLPVQSQEELNKLEEVLQNSTQENILIRKLSNYGGLNLRSTINNVMRNAISSELGVRYTMQGRTGKPAFLNLSLCKCVQDAVKASPFGNTTSISEINRFIATHLALSKDRLSERKGKSPKSLVDDVMKESENDARESTSQLIDE